MKTTQMQIALDAYWEVLCDFGVDSRHKLFSHPEYYQVPGDYRMHHVAYDPDDHVMVSVDMSWEEQFLLLSFVCNMLESELEQAKEENAAPRYQHDCCQCVSLGALGNADLYYCDQGKTDGSTVIARYSDEGSDYTSGIIGAEYSRHLSEALRRATQRGYYKGE